MTTPEPKYEFLASTHSKANSKNEHLGTLITHNSMMLYLNSYNKDKSVQYYTCSKRKTTGCLAKATVHKNEDKYVVHKCASLEDHNHEGDVAAVLSERILLEMAEKTEVIKKIIFNLKIFNAMLF